jgi:hypothetical protein
MITCPCTLRSICMSQLLSHDLFCSALDNRVAFLRLSGPSVNGCSGARWEGGRQEVCPHRLLPHSGSPSVLPILASWSHGGSLCSYHLPRTWHQEWHLLPGLPHCPLWDPSFLKHLCIKFPVCNPGLFFCFMTGTWLIQCLSSFSTIHLLIKNIVLLRLDRVGGGRKRGGWIIRIKIQWHGRNKS